MPRLPVRWGHDLHPRSSPAVPAMACGGRSCGCHPRASGGRNGAGLPFELLPRRGLSRPYERPDPRARKHLLRRPISISRLAPISELPTKRKCEKAAGRHRFALYGGFPPGAGRPFRGAAALLRLSGDLLAPARKVGSDGRFHPYQGRRDEGCFGPPKPCATPPPPPPRSHCQPPSAALNLPMATISSPSTSCGGEARKGPWLIPYGGVGLGACYPHVEMQRANCPVEARTFEYQFAGPAFRPSCRRRVALRGACRSSSNIN